MKKTLFSLLLLTLIFQERAIIAQTCLSAGTTLTTQAQIDAFPITYAGCRNTGALTIKGNDIRNLNGLNALVTVSALTIENCPVLNGLTGLSNLTSVQNSLAITNCSSVTNLNGLGGLTTVGGQLRVSNNGGLTSLFGLTNLQSIGTLGVYGLRILTNPNLTSINSLGNVATIAGGLEIVGNSSLTLIDGFASLMTVGQALLIQNNAVLTSISGLNALISIGDQLNIGANAALAAISGFTALTSITNYVIMEYNVSLTHLSGFNNLKTLGSLLRIQEQRALTSISGFNGLEALNTTRIQVDGNIELISISGFANLTSAGALEITRNYKLEEVTGFSKLSILYQALAIDSNEKLTNINSLNAVESVGSGELLNDRLSISGSTSMKHLNIFNNLVNINGNLFITAMDSITDITGFNKLTNITGTFFLRANSYATNTSELTQILGFNKLTTIGRLTITENSNLEGISAFNHAISFTLRGSTWNLEIYNNPKLSICHVQSVCDWLTTDAGYDTYIGVYGNLTGCESKLTVLNKCLTVIPVTLTTFKAQSLGQTNLLTWQTETEINTSNFEIERSSDGLVFEKIGTIKAQNKKATYRFEDNAPLSIINYYRLKINDLGNKFNYSKVEVVASEKQELIAHIFPNPVYNDLIINIISKNKAQLIVKLIDILGREIQHFSVPTEGITHLSIPMNNLPNGTYFVKIFDGQRSIQEKIIRQ